MTEKTYTSEDGLSLFYRDFGCTEPKGVPVVCLPGLTRNSRDFAFTATHIAKSRRVICPDFRGRGFSDFDPTYMNYQPMTYASDVVLLLASLNLNKVVFLGTSLGGIVTTILGATQPHLLAGAIINDIGPELDPVGLTRIQNATGQTQPISNWQDAAREVERLNGFAHPLRPKEYWAEFARALCREDENGVPRFDYDPKIGDAAREAPAADPNALWSLYGAMKAVPMLAVRGEISDLLSETTFGKMKEIKPDLEQAIIPGVGHAPGLDEPAAVKAIDDFLFRVT